MSEPRVLLIVATLGRRPEFLRETLESIRSQNVASDVVMVAPTDNESVQELAAEFGCEVLPDPGSLAAAINLGATRLRPHHEFVNWLNDDDLLEPGSLDLTTKALDAHPDAVVAFGTCRYIDPAGRLLWVSGAGAWAPRILSWGPDLVPQPGMLIRARSWADVGGLDETYQLAFDLDLLLRLKRIGRLHFVDASVSCFRWHPGSLTVDDRSRNIAESERAKRDHLNPLARALSPVWQPVVRTAIRHAAKRVDARARAVQSTPE